MNYVLVGAGGTGTHLLPALITYLRAFHNNTDWNLFIIDGDVVESKNLERQIFMPSAITMNKAEAAILPYGSDEHIQAIPEYLTEGNIEKFIQNGDVVLIAVDNFTVRKRIEDYALKLMDVVVINGGNEKWDGSVQLWVRAKGEDLTPRIGYLHPEIAVGIGADRAEMTCVQAAALPGGQQTLVVNMQSATWMMTALWRFHNNGHVLSTKQAPSPLTWTELQFDVLKGTVEHIDQRLSAHWRTT